jgi:hypothetical protein
VRTSGARDDQRLRAVIGAWIKAECRVLKEIAPGQLAFTGEPRDIGLV